VVGRLTFREDGDPIDCRRMGVGGKAIPPNIDKARRSGGCIGMAGMACHAHGEPHALLGLLPTPSH
jgi:hypothetical protein